MVPVARIDFSNTSNLIFTFDDGVTAANLWPRKCVCVPPSHTNTVNAGC